MGRESVNRMVSAEERPTWVLGLEEAGEMVVPAQPWVGGVEVWWVSDCAAWWSCGGRRIVGIGGARQNMGFGKKEVWDLLLRRGGEGDAAGVVGLLVFRGRRGMAWVSLGVLGQV